ncbi:hypothetical protein PoB_003641000 [Plakobranchus ocellatus]|uniref:Uncharacterized protein n=1 Tax=Plakobranchus ocellatus TaxID=259542 RepID=A0AAV4ARG4_9GAST|nr:hypothetical protein PoB_003641000 [Plakobranchus ocellatus]
MWYLNRFEISTENCNSACTPETASGPDPPLVAKPTESRADEQGTRQSMQMPGIQANSDMSVPDNSTFGQTYSSWILP